MHSGKAMPPRTRFRRPKPMEILVGAMQVTGDQHTPGWVGPTFMLVFWIYGELNAGDVTLWRHTMRAVNASTFQEALQIKRIAQRYCDRVGRLPNLSVPWWQWGKNCAPRALARREEARAA